MESDVNIHIQHKLYAYYRLDYDHLHHTSHSIIFFSPLLLIEKLEYRFHRRVVRAHMIFNSAAHARDWSDHLRADLVLQGDPLRHLLPKRLLARHIIDALLQQLLQVSVFRFLNFH